jgi:hypothetical protein
MCSVGSLTLLQLQEHEAAGSRCSYPGHPIGRPNYAPTHCIPYSFDAKDGPHAVCSLCAEDYMRNRFGGQRMKDALACDEAGERADYDAPA